MGHSDQPHRATMVLSVTSVHVSGCGDHVLIGRDEAGAIARALLPAGNTPRLPSNGEAWRLTGTIVEHAQFGPQLHAELGLPLIPRGQAIIRHLATDKRFPGVGWATAERLWGYFNEQLFDVISQRNVAALATLIGAEKSVTIIEGFGLLDEEVEVYRWLDKYGVSPRVAGAAARIWGKNAIARIGADPYAVTLLETWADVDARALRLGVALDDNRRQLAAVDEALSAGFRAGHMASRRTAVAALVRNYLAPWRGDPEAAINAAISSGRVTLTEQGLLQSLACCFMERTIVEAVTERASRPARTIDRNIIETAIAMTECEAGYTLTEAQKQAVTMAATRSVGIITGGAGTGKTTVVRAILAVLEAAAALRSTTESEDYVQVQVALAGRAARRIAEATGREACTLSKLIHDIEVAGRRISRGTVIFDESSMLDTPSVYRILSQLPSEIDLLFVGDPAQLPPIGPGLPFHAMAASSALPRTVLDVVHRQNDATGIAAIAGAVRVGCVPQFGHFNANFPLQNGVHLVPASSADIAEKTMAIFRAMCGRPPRSGRTADLHSLDVQILAQTRLGPAGSKNLNQIIEREYMAHQRPIDGWGLSVGSKVLWLKNDYEKAPRRDSAGKLSMDPETGKQSYAGFMNGSIGTIEAPCEKGAWVKFDNGAEDVISEKDLVNLTHGWAINVHKAQGSAFKRVIIPVTRSKLLDRALIYTAITRGIQTVVLVGDPSLIEQTISNEPRRTLSPAGNSEPAMQFRL